MMPARRPLPIHRPTLRWVATALALLSLTTAACARDDATPGPDRFSASPDKGSDGSKGDKGDKGGKGDGRTKGSGGSADGDDAVGASEKKACPTPGSADPGPEAARTATLIEGGDGEVHVDAVVYPHPRYEGKPWSQWGQGISPSEGRFLSAIGDHCGINGNAYFYEYDASDGELRRTADVLSAIDHHDGAWGYGKVHGQIVQGPDDDLYAMTYWGSDDGITYGDGYDGDLLVRLDSRTGAIEEVLGAPLPGYGTPSLTSAPELGLIYGEAVDPDTKPKQGVFFVYDLARREVVFTMEKGETVYRNVLVDQEGRAWFSTGSGTLHVYDPSTGEATEADVRLPGEYLRASSRPGPNGTVYGVTREPDVLFALRPSGEIEELGPVRGYVTSIALSPDGRHLYYVPDAHGTSFEQGTPLISVDTRTGKETVVVELDQPAEDKLHLRLGGSYGLAVDPSGDRIYVGLNAGALDAENAFGEVVLAVVDLP